MEAGAYSIARRFRKINREMCFLLEVEDYFIVATDFQLTHRTHELLSSALYISRITR